MVKKRTDIHRMLKYKALYNRVSIESEAQHLHGEPPAAGKAPAVSKPSVVIICKQSGSNVCIFLHMHTQRSGRDPILLCCLVVPSASVPLLTWIYIFLPFINAQCIFQLMFNVVCIHDFKSRAPRFCFTGSQNATVSRGRIFGCWSSGFLLWKQSMNLMFENV